METRLLSLWDGLVGSAALIAIIVLALCVMMNAVKLGEVPRRLGAIVGVVILLVMLPSIIVSLWNSMTFLQHLGDVLLETTLLLFLCSLRRNRATKKPRR